MGAGVEVGIGSTAAQSYLHVRGSTPEYLSSIIWENPQEADSACFAVLPPQDMARRYFGVTSRADETGDKMWVEGVDLHSMGSHYGKILVSYDALTDPDARVPLAAGAFVDSMRSYITRRHEGDATTTLGIDQNTHQRLGSTLLSLWDTLSLPPSIETKRPESRNAFDLARQIINQGVDQSAKGKLECRFDKITAYEDTRGIVSGFVGEDSRTNSMTALVRNYMVYPERIDYIQIPLSYNGGDAIVSHYAISPNHVGTRFCVVPNEKVSSGNVTDLITAIQRSPRSLRGLDQEASTDLIRELYGELGKFVQASESPISQE
jgi:hypothetical protein